ncbi:MAG: ATP-binding protein [Planctomycetes bacterium]|nr:ATP-binding protein [Planctomycetota bacterium]
MAEDVSSFANGIGGTSIYGVEEFKNQNPRYKIESGYPANGTNHKDQVVAILETQVLPPLNSAMVTKVEVDSATGNYVLAVEVARAEIEPYQAYGKYHIRRDGKKGVMNHYEVKEAMFRRLHPNLVVGIRLHHLEVMCGNGPQANIKTIHEVCVSNLGRVMANEFLIRLETNGAFRLDTKYQMPNTIVADGKFQVVTGFDFMPNQGRTGMVVVPIRIFPGQIITSGNHHNGFLYEKQYAGGSRQRLEFSELVRCDHNDLEIKWEIFADNAAAKSGAFSLDKLVPKVMKPSYRGFRNADYALSEDDLRALGCVVELGSE